jgi:hypothetical protein
MLTWFFFIFKYFLLCTGRVTLMAGNQVDLVLQTYIGMTIREATDAAIKASLSTKPETELADASNSSHGGELSPSSSSSSSSFTTQADNSNLETVSLVLRIVLAALLVVGSTLWSRYMLRKILRDNEEVGDSDMGGSGGGSGGGGAMTGVFPMALDAVDVVDVEEGEREKRGAADRNERSLFS